MGYPVQQSTTSQPLLFLMISSSDHLAGKTGLTPTVILSKAGAAFASPAGVVTEVGNGWYQVAGNATDDNTLGPLLLHATATGADPCDDVFGVVAYNPLAATNLGLTSLDVLVSSRVATTSLPTNFSLLAIDSGGRVEIQSGVTRNVALAKFPFLMVLSSDHITAATGKTVTATRSIDGGAFASCTNTPVEVGNGIYTVDLSAADLNGTNITFRFTASACDDRFVSLETTP